jgi:hypothetical protein
MRLDLQRGEALGAARGVDQLGKTLFEVRGDFCTHREILF